MVANPERESSSKRGVGGVKDDLRRIFIGARSPADTATCAHILEGFAADCIVVDSMFFGALPLALRPPHARPALACVGIMPYASNSRDAAPFGVALLPGSGPLHRLRNATMNWATEHFALADIQRFAPPPPTGRSRLGRLLRLLHRSPTKGGRRLSAGDGGGL